MNRKLFITAAPVGAVSKYHDPSESKFISDEELEKYLSSQEKQKVIQMLQKDGWEKRQDGGLMWKSNNKILPIIHKYNIELINNSALQTKLIIQLTAQGFCNDAQGDLFWNHKTGDCYITDDLVKALEKDAMEFIAYLQGHGWQKCPSGYDYNFKVKTPYLPITPNNIIEEALSCADAGAAIVHLHTRSQDDISFIDIVDSNFHKTINPQKNHIDTWQYNKILPEIMYKNSNLILNLSTSARGDGTQCSNELRRAHLVQYGLGQYHPDLASLSLGAVYFGNQDGYENDDLFIINQLDHFKKTGITPEIEVFNKTILHNVCKKWVKDLKALGKPMLFMLIIGVSQVKFQEESGEWIDDALVPSEVCNMVVKYLMHNTPQAKKQAIELIVEHIAPIITQLKMHYESIKISILTAGIIQLIIADLAMQLDIDGVRVGLEDALNITDDTISGKVRRAYSTAEQVQLVRKTLIDKGVHIQDAESLREELKIPRPNIQAFYHIKNTLQPYISASVDIIKYPSAGEIIEQVKPLFRSYCQQELYLLEAVMIKTNTINNSYNELSKIITQLIHHLNIGVRYFIEEVDRYSLPEQVPVRDLYIIHNLNYMRALAIHYQQDASVFEQALLEYAAAQNIIYEVILIPDAQFKSPQLRFLEHISFIPCKYNADRTNILNYNVRFDAHYSATMAILFNAMKAELLILRHTSNASPKATGIKWYTLGRNGNTKLQWHDSGLNTQFNNIDELAQSWILLPSTPTTNYPLGMKLATGLAETFYNFLKQSQREVSIVGAIHSGYDDKQKEMIIEATMLLNRFLSNMDTRNKLTSYSCQLIYEQLLLPRIVQSANELQYLENGLVKRDACGTPLYQTNQPVKKIASSRIGNMPMLKLLAHSSGITTMQQLDNLLLQDMTILEFTAEECIRIFDRAIVISFASASDVLLNSFGTSVIDLTACNDIRSLAGTTTADYLCSTAEAWQHFKHQVLQFRQNGNSKESFDNKYCRIIHQQGSNGKQLLRIADLFLFDDPQRLHDGHSIKRYLQDSPAFIREWLAHIDSGNGKFAASQIIALLKNHANTNEAYAA